MSARASTLRLHPVGLVLVPWLIVVAGATSADVTAQAPAASGAPESRNGSAGVAEALAAVERLVAAFNDHDPDAMARAVTDDFELYYVDDSGVAALSVSGPRALRDEMVAYFTARPDVRSRMTDVAPGLRFVAFREQIVGGASSIAVYEVAEGKVRRSWYYPEEVIPPGRSPR